MRSSKKSAKSLLYLVVAVVLLVSYISYVEIPKEEAKIQAVKVFPAIRKDELEKLYVKNEFGEVTLVANEKEPNISTLQFQSIPGVLVSEVTVDEVVAALQNLTTEDGVTEDVEEDKAIYGLSPAVMILKVKFKGSDEKTIEIGKDNKFVTKRYAKIGNDPKVYFISDELYSAANLKEEGFKERKPIKFEEYKLATVKFDEFTISQDELAVWSVTSPGKYKTNSSAVMKLLSDIKGNEVVSFLKESERPKTFTNTIVFTSKDGKTLELKFVQNKDKSVTAVLSNQPLAFKFNAGFFDTIEVALENIRIKNPLTFVRSDIVKSIDVYQKNGDSYVVSAVKEEGKDAPTWKLEGSDKAPDANFVNQWIADLSQLKVAGYPRTSANFGLGDSAIKKLTINSNDASITVAIGNKSSNNEYYASFSNYEGEIFILTDDTVKKIFPTLEVIKS